MSGDMDKAAEWLYKVQDTGLKPNIINGCATSGDMEEAEWLSKQDTGLRLNID